MEQDGARPNEAEEAGWGQILQDFVGPVKDFVPYSMSNGMDATKVLQSGKEGEKYKPCLYF